MAFLSKTWLTSRLAGAVAAFVAALASHGAAEAQVTRIDLGYRCDVGGAPGELVASVEIYGLTEPPGGWRATYVWGVIMTPGSRTFYGGLLSTQTAAYAFTGEAGYAEFTDLTRGGSFYVQVAPQGDNLTLVVDPQAPQTTAVECRLVGLRRY